MSAMLHSLQHSVRRAAGRAALSTLAGLMVVVGLGFLTTALWIWIATTHGSLFAAAIIGALYFGLGLILLAVGMPSKRRHYRAPPPPIDPTAAVIAQVTEGFLTGMRAGRATRR
ncbi:phage holin family protein [Donghicola sp. XS_ASV15]|uniref:phage holin family protein n=1 Tax=Donghicola sp. XS_ASV15 TaxID=3241295 RepID=UPI00351410A9